MGSTGLNLNSSGVSSGSGIDVTSVVDQIIYAEKAPERSLQTQLSNLTAQETALSSLGSKLSTLQGQVNNLKDFSGALAAKTVSSSRTDLLTASSDTTASPGSHAIVISSLATGSSYVTSRLTDAQTTFNQGSFDLSLGNSAPATITVNGSNNTIGGLARYINQQNLGVTASVINDSNGARLALVSNATGQPADLTISNNSTGLSFTKTATALNASFTVDGVPISTAANTVTGVLPGVTLNLLGAAPNTAVTLKVSSDSSRIQQAVSDFVTAYNSVISSINAQFRFDPSTNSAGVLATSGDLRRIQASILNDITYMVTGNNGFTSLRSFGIDMNNDGTLTVDNAALSDGISNHFTDFQNFFQSVAPSGFARNFSSDLQNLTDSTQGLLAVNLRENDSGQRQIQQQINDFEDRMTARRTQLVAEYSKIDTMLRQYPSLLAQITGQLGTTTTK